MIGNKLEQSIISVFQKNPSRTFSINEIAHELRKSYPIINQKSNFLLKEGVLRKINVGRSYQCFLNSSSEKARLLIAINEINSTESFSSRSDSNMQLCSEIGRAYDAYTLKARRSILFVLIRIDVHEILFVSENTSTDVTSEINSSLLIPPRYKISLFSESEFLDKFIEERGLQENHVVVINVDIYLRSIAKIYEKLLMRGMLGSREETKEGTTKKDHIIKTRG